MLAASKDDIEMVKVLVEQGKAKIEKPDKYKKTALVHAVMNGASKVNTFYYSLLILLHLRKTPLVIIIFNFHLYYRSHHISWQKVRIQTRLTRQRIRVYIMHVLMDGIILLIS